MSRVPDAGRRALIAAAPAAAAAVALAPLAPSVGAAPAKAARWQGGWGRTLVRDADPRPITAGTTYRETLRSSLGGDAVRIVFSNEAGDAPLSIAAATLRIGGDAVPLRFGGRLRILVPAGATAVSDPVARPIAPGAAIDVSLLFDRDTLALTIDRRGKPTGAWLAAGDQTAAPVLTGGREVAPAFVKSLEIASRTARPVLVVLSDTKSAGEETWTPMLAQRAAGRLGVVNRSLFAGHLSLGPAGNSALARFDRDVLATAGATHVLIFTGNNDLIQPGMRNAQGRLSLDPGLAMSVEELTAMLAQAVARARSAGLVAVGGTWTAYEGVTIADGYSSPEKMAKRAAVNDWIRSPGAFDAVIDFDRVLRDPVRPSRLDPRFDEGNHFTPNAAGYAAMADAALKALIR